METGSRLYVLREKAVPDVLLRVVRAKVLLESGKTDSVQEAVQSVGLSRSSFYKYRDDIFEYHESSRGHTVTLVIQLDDEPGNLSLILTVIAKFNANILTIHQSIPVNGIAALTLSVDMIPDTSALPELCSVIEESQGVHYVKVLSGI
jgi:chorismate mutase